MSDDKQHITVTGRAANDRIDKAIPVFENRFGWNTDQATAVAIRQEDHTEEGKYISLYARGIKGRDGNGETYQSSTDQSIQEEEQQKESNKKASIVGGSVSWGKEGLIV